MFVGSSHLPRIQHLLSHITIIEPFTYQELRTIIRAVSPVINPMPPKTNAVMDIIIKLVSIARRMLLIPVPFTI